MERLTSSLQESAVVLMCYDSSPRGAALVHSLVPAEMLEPYFKEIALAAKNHLKRFGEPPGDHTQDILDTLCARYPKRARNFQQVYESILVAKEHLTRGSRDFVIDKLQTFVLGLHIRAGVTEALKGIKKDTEEGIKEAHAALTNTLKHSSQSFRVGVFLHDTKAVLDMLAQDEEDEFVTGIGELDKAGVIPRRGQLMMLAAPAKLGKTWFEFSVGEANMMRGFNVLYASYETRERTAVKRTIQTIFSVLKRRGDELYKTVIERGEDGHLLSLNRKEMTHRPSFQDDDIQSTVAGFTTHLKNRGKFLLREFPTNSHHVSDLEAFIMSLEAENFIPDVVLVDYVDLFKLDSKNPRTSLQEATKELRGMAARRNCAVVTVTQINRAGSDRAIGRTTDIGEDYGKVANVDTLLIYGQTDQEREVGLARVKVAAAREDEDKFTVMITQSYSIGQFCMDSVRMSNDYWPLMKAAAKGTWGVKAGELPSEDTEE